MVTVVYTFFSVFASLYLMPLRLLHPLLRAVGLKNHFLPIDIVQKHYCRGFLYLCGVTVQWQGIEHLVSTTCLVSASTLHLLLVASVADGVACELGVLVVVEQDYGQPVVGMFSHASNMDPMILASGPFAYKWCTTITYCG